MFTIFSRLLFTFTAALAFTPLSHAQDFQLGGAAISGTGCPNGSAAVAMSPDKKTISILFDKFSIEAPAGTRGGKVKCHVRIQVRNITPGYVLDTTTFDFRGFAELPEGTIAVLSTRGGAEGAGRDNVVQEQLSSSGDFLITRVAQQAHVNRCRSRANDQIKLDVALSLSPRDILKSDGIVTIDTSDLGNDSGMKVGVALKQCDEKSGKIKDIIRAQRQEDRKEQREERREERRDARDERRRLTS